MPEPGRRARVAHAIPGRLRLRFDGEPPRSALHVLGVTPGIHAVDVNPAARSAVIRYAVAETTEAAIVAELARAGIDLVSTTASTTSPAAATPGAKTSGAKTSGAKTSGAKTPDGAGAGTVASDSASDGKSTLYEMLVGPPPKLDRRFAESLALSAVSLLAARRVGAALGGGTTLPAYFAVWFALRRLTGAGRRR